MCVLTYARAQGFFANQFENLANSRAHYCSTGPEIWQQACGRIDAFVAGAGTGGTIAGISTYLKEQDANIVVCLVDPPGSGLLNKVKHGVMYDSSEREGSRRRHQVDTVTEGVGACVARARATFCCCRSAACTQASIA